jgi:hypothetical protein
MANEINASAVVNRRNIGFRNIVIFISLTLSQTQAITQKEV